VKQRLQDALAGSIDEILQRIYDSRPTLPPMDTSESDEATVRAMELIDRCYQVSFKKIIKSINQSIN